MTLEGEVVFGVGGVDVLNGHTALNATQCKSCGGTRLFVQEYTHTPMLSRQKRKISAKQVQMFDKLNASIVYAVHSYAPSIPALHCWHTNTTFLPDRIVIMET